MAILQMKLAQLVPLLGLSALSIPEENVGAELTAVFYSLGVLPVTLLHKPPTSLLA